MKKLTRKMIPAFAMLLLSAVLMSTASFAWFSMNTNVSATGFEVQATAPAALWIAKGTSGYGTTISFTPESPATAKQIAPVTRDPSGTYAGTNASAWKFYGLTEDEYGYKAVKNDGTVDLVWEEVKEGDTITAHKNVVEDTAWANVYKTSFYLKLEGTNTGVKNTTDMRTVSAKATLSWKDKETGRTADDIYQSLRIAIVTDGKVGTGEGTNATQFSEGGCSVYSFAELGTAYDPSTALGGTASFLTIAAQEDVKVWVYVWFEGTDGTCMNANAQNLDVFSIDLAFVCGPVGG